MSRDLAFSLFFFASSEETLHGDKYRLVLDAARFGDAHGFEAVWVPERHFASFGGLYPNPSVLHAALAASTERIALRAGSVVLPLHHPIRIAEEWSMVDNLSGGRVGISFAPGWNPHDFTFFPERYRERHQALFDGLETVHRLWRGERLAVPSGHGGETEVEIYPKPVQPVLPTWVTAAGNPESFRRAGEKGTNLLTHLLDQDLEGLTEKLDLYRRARAEHGHDPDSGVVTLMVHTFLGEDEETTRELGRDPYCQFLKSNAGLLKGLATSRGLEGPGVDFESLSEEDQDSFVGFLYDRFVDSRALIGTPEGSLDLVLALYRAGVDEIACLLDFGPSFDQVLTGLPHLERLKALAEEAMAQTVPRRALAERPGPTAPATGASSEGTSLPSLPELQARLGEELSGELFYQRLADAGFDVPESLQGVEILHRGDGEALGRLAVPSVTDGDALPAPFLEACLQVALAAASGDLSQPWLPWSFDGLAAPSESGAGQETMPAGLWCHAVLLPYSTASEHRVRLTLLSAEGAPWGPAGTARLRPAPALPSEPMAHSEEEDGWFYEMDWVEAAPAADTEAPTVGRWLVLADASGAGEALAASLEARGHEVRRLSGGDLEPLSAEGVREHLAEAVKDGSLTGVAHLLALDATPLEETDTTTLAADQRRSTGSALLLLQALAALPDSPLPRLWIVTRGAQAVGSGPVAAVQAPLWGLGRTSAVEHPECWGGLVDLDPQAPVAAGAEALAEILTTPGAENQIALREGHRRVPRLSRRPETPVEPLAIRGDGSYLVTGGHTGLGLEVCRRLAESGAGHLLILGRTPLPPGDEWDDLDPDSRPGRIAADLAALEGLGAPVTYRSVDVADEARVTAFLTEMEELGVPPIRGVVHAASVWRDGAGGSLIRSLAQLDLEALAQVLGPKVLGGFVLHKHLADAPLELFKMFSSGASLLGSAGQGNYAAANSFLDALAHHRHERGLPALSVNWGAVSEVGFGATEEGTQVHEQWERNGLHRISPAELLDALFRLAAEGSPQVGAMKVDWGRLGRLFPDLVRSPWASRLVEAGSERAPSAVLRSLREAPVGDRLGRLTDHLQEQIGDIMGMLPPTDKRLFELGMDSLMAVALRNRLEASLEAEIRVTTVFNFPTIDSLARHLAEEVLGLVPPASPAAAPTTAPEARDSVAQVEELSDDEVARRLAERLAARGASS